MALQHDIDIDAFCANLTDQEATLALAILGVLFPQGDGSLEYVDDVVQVVAG